MSWDSSERRRFVRAKVPCEITIHNPQEHTIFTHAENISAGGLRFIIEERLKISSIVGLDIYGIKKKPIVCKGRVMWVFTRKAPKSGDSSVFDTGIEFYEIKNRDRLAIKNLAVSIIAANK